VQQLREAFPFESAPRFLIFNRDAKYGLEVPGAVRSMKISPVRTSFESPWQNGVAERWVESYRRDLLDHIVAVNERHLKRLLSEYVRYYHEDRTHLGLGKGTPNGRIKVGPVVKVKRRQPQFIGRSGPKNNQRLLGVRMEERKLGAKSGQVVELYDCGLRKPLVQIISQGLRLAAAGFMALC
jgi:integrase-like protein